MATIDIDANGDLIVQAVEYDSTIIYQAGDKKVPKQTRSFKVSRTILIKHSTTFEKMLSAPWAESQHNTIKIEECVKRIEVILRVLHKCSLVPTMSGKELWLLVEGLDYYRLDIQLFESYFAKSYNALPKRLENAQELIFLTWRFDRAKDFGRLTKYLAYSAIGHIQESNPTEVRHLHLPPRIVQQINAVKGRLRVILHHGLFEINERLLKATCICRKETLFDYERHLLDIGIWPMEKAAAKNSIECLFQILDKFSYRAKDSACKSCREDYCIHIKEVVSRVRSYFDGLCLDCLDRSKPRLGDRDNDYWLHNDLDAEDWDRKCRITHGEPSWYFSFMGRKEDMDQFLRKTGGRGARDFGR